MGLSVCKINSKRCLLGRKTSLSAFVQNLFIDVAKESVFSKKIRFNLRMRQEQS